MVVTPKANDLTGRNDSKGYTMGTQSDKVSYLVSDQVTARRCYEQISRSDSRYIPYRVMNRTHVIFPILRDVT